MDKPVKEVIEPAWNFFEICRYIEEKYQIDSDDFQSWICSSGSIHNGCYCYINIKEDIEYEKTRPEIKKFLQLLLDEFDEEEMHVWISW